MRVYVLYFTQKSSMSSRSSPLSSLSPAAASMRERATLAAEVERRSMRHARSLKWEGALLNITSRRDYTAYNWNC